MEGGNINLFQHCLIKEITSLTILFIWKFPFRAGGRLKWATSCYKISVTIFSNWGIARRTRDSAGCEYLLCCSVIERFRGMQFRGCNFCFFFSHSHIILDNGQISPSSDSYLKTLIAKTLIACLKNPDLPMSASYLLYICTCKCAGNNLHKYPALTPILYKSAPPLELVVRRPILISPGPPVIFMAL